MANIEVRQSGSEDIKAIANICYRTGYMGEDLSGLNLFNDKVLFSYFFSDYYPLYESNHSFVAVDKDKENLVVGYIIGTENSVKQTARYIQKMSLKVASRLLLYTSWKYPESFKAVCFMAFSSFRGNGVNRIYKDYPAHLHINILPQYQRLGIGSALIDSFEKHMKSIGIKGIHLATSNKNYKALSFYESKGYHLAFEGRAKVWNVGDYKSMIFVKKLI